MNDQLLRFFIEVITSRLLWFSLAMIGLILMLYLWGLFSAIKRITWDCLTDAQGKVTINNLARFLAMLSFILTFIGVHFELHVYPHFQILTKPFSEWEMLLILGFIAGAELVKKFNPTTKPSE